MEFLKKHKTRILKWGGIALACLVVAVGAFVGARYVASGNEFPGKLEQLIPADATVVLHVPNLPQAHRTTDGFLDDLLTRPGLALIESSPMWRTGPGKAMDGGLAQFREQTLVPALQAAERAAEQAGVTLFDDIGGGELYVASDPSGIVALSRVTRPVRFRWQFMDLAGGFLPDGPDAPKFEYSDGVLRVTPPGGATLHVALLDDVQVVATSPRLFNATVAAHGGGPSIATRDGWLRARALPTPEDSQRHTATLWLNLERMRELHGAEKVDAFTTLPPTVLGIYPDIMAPLNQVLSRNLDTAAFSAALYGLDLSVEGNLRFDQYLLADESMLSRPELAYLRETWSQTARPLSQLRLLPADAMFQVSYRQPLEVLYSQVFDESARKSLLGDFLVAARGPAVAGQTSSPIEEILFASAPQSYAPGASLPVAGTDMPLPAFAIGFRTPGARPEAARALLEDYLQAQRGRSTEPGAPPRTGAVTVVEKPLAGSTAYAFNDPRPDDNFIKRLNDSIRAAVVDEWILLTNSEPLLVHAMRATRGDARTLANTPDSPFEELDTAASASLYLDLGGFVDYATSGPLVRIMRETRYNKGLVDGRDPGEVRREIAASFGLNPADVASLDDPRVAAEFEKRRQAWVRICQVEGDRYVANLSGNLGALRAMRDLALTTRFNTDHVHVQGLLRLR